GLRRLDLGRRRALLHRLFDRPQPLRQRRARRARGQVVLGVRQENRRQHAVARHQPILDLIAPHRHTLPSSAPRSALLACSMYPRAADSVLPITLAISPNGSSLSTRSTNTTRSSSGSPATAAATSGASSFTSTAPVASADGSFRSSSAPPSG